RLEESHRVALNVWTQVGIAQRHVDRCMAEKLLNGVRPESLDEPQPCVRARELRDTPPMRAVELLANWIGRFVQCTGDVDIIGQRPRQKVEIVETRVTVRDHRLGSGGTASEDSTPSAGAVTSRITSSPRRTSSNCGRSSPISGYFRATSARVTRAQLST